MVNLFKLNYVFLLCAIASLFAVSSCGEKEETSSSVVKTDQSKEVKNVANLFWKEMCSKNYRNAKNFATKSSRKSLLKLSKYENEIDVCQFREVDSCWFNLDSTKAFCFFEFVQSSQVKSDIVQLVKNNFGWKVKYVLGETNDNTFMFDYSLTKSTRSPKRSFDFVMSNVDLNYFNYYVKDLGGTLPLGVVSEGELRLIIEDRFDEFSLNQNLMELPSLMSINTYVVDEDTFEINFGSIDESDAPEMFRIFINSLIEDYGVPMNAKKINPKDYFKYVSLRWFCNSYNQQIEIRNFNTSITVTFSSIV